MWCGGGFLLRTREVGCPGEGLVLRREEEMEQAEIAARMQRRVSCLPLLLRTPAPNRLRICSCLTQA